MDVDQPLSRLVESARWFGASSDVGPGSAVLADARPSQVSDAVAPVPRQPPGVPVKVGPSDCGGISEHSPELAAELSQTPRRSMETPVKWLWLPDFWSRGSSRGIRSRPRPWVGSLPDESCADRRARACAGVRGRESGGRAQWVPTIGDNHLRSAAESALQARGRSRRYMR